MKLDGTVLGFDVGARRIGVAVGSAFGNGAESSFFVDRIPAELIERVEIPPLIETADRSRNLDKLDQPRPRIEADSTSSSPDDLPPARSEAFPRRPDGAMLVGSAWEG